MRKTIFSIIFLCGFFLSSFAVEEEPVEHASPSEMFPPAGSFGIGLDATPFLNYLGNMANGTMGNSLNLGDNRLYFRYFLTQNAAVRLSLQMGLNKSSATFMVQDDNAFLNDPLSNMQVEDRRTFFNNDISLRAGYQHFIGENRLRGFVGGDVGYGYNKLHYLYEYGNVMNEQNPAPTRVINWNNGSTGNTTQRPLESVFSTTNSILGGLFTGAEYYLLPQFAVGLELGLSYGLSIPGKNYEVYENMVGSQLVEMTQVTGRGTRSRSIYSTTPYTYGNLYLVFHF
ncbi:MAG: hypothetical protein EA361_11600 [Bacteroidetes bacterium]|nr:MAG: hypothetical protein EA361_11600 [Bacteroidota bacterium]